MLFRPWEVVCFAVGLSLLCAGSGAFGLWLGLQPDIQTLDQRTQLIERQLTARAASAEAVLTSLAGVLQASDELRPFAFLDLSRRLLTTYPFIRAASEIDVVDAEARTDWESRMRAEAFPTVGITSHDGPRAIDASGAPDRLYPIGFTEPLTPENARLIGFDIGSHPGIRDALELAVDTDWIAASEIVSLDAASDGWLILRAVYLGHVSPATAGGRWNQLSGLVALHIDKDGFFRDVVEAYDDIEIAFRDVRGDDIVYRHGRLAPTIWPRLPVLTATDRLAVNGQNFAIRTRFRPAWSAAKLALLAAFAAFPVVTGFAAAAASRNHRIRIRQSRDAAQRIDESKQRFQDYAEVASDWFWSMDADLRFDDISDGASRAGLDTKDLIGRTRAEIAAGDPDMQAQMTGHLADLAARRNFRDFRYSIDYDNGRTRWYSVSGKPVYDANGTFVGYRGTAREITADVEAEDELRTAKEQAELANRTKSEFLASMSHELRTPLNAILGFSEVIRDNALETSDMDAYRAYAGDIHDCGQHLLGLINDILDLAKIESGKDELDECDIAVPDVIEAVRTLVQSRADTGQVALEIEVERNLPRLLADERKLKQILVNLLTNAIKFTEPGGSVTLRAWCRPDSGFVFQVVDTGIGMAPEDIPTALSQFAQIDSGLDRKYEGTGLGLPLTKALVEQHGGSFELYSRIGIGTTATVRLPSFRIAAAERPRTLLTVGGDRRTS